MAKKTKLNQYNIELMQPDEIVALRLLVKEFMNRMTNVDNEIETLKEDRKALIEEYSSKLDMKTLTAALKVLKIQRGVEHRDTYELFISALEDPSL